MDTAGVCMWADVQLGPYFAKLRNKCCLVWDNCGPHKVPAVRAIFKEWGIVAKELPPKMTDVLQVMDLIVNGPIKSGIRRERIQALFDYFQNWKIDRLKFLADKDRRAEALPPAFQPPKPTQTQGLLIVFKVIKQSLETPAFQESMKKCFQKVGLTRLDDGSFAVYSPTVKGILSQHISQPAASTGEFVSVGEVATELAVTSRPDPSVVVIVQGWIEDDSASEASGDEDGESDEC